MSIPDSQVIDNAAGVMPTIRPPLSKAEKDEFFAYVVRCPRAFHAACAAWQRDFFDGSTDAHYNVLWRKLNELADRHGNGDLPPNLRPMLETEVRAAAGSQSVPEVILNPLLGQPMQMGGDERRQGGLLADIFGRQQADLDATQSRADELLSRVANEYGPGRMVLDFAGQCNGQMPTPDSVDALLQRLNERVQNQAGDGGRLQLISSADFAAGTYANEWLIEHVLVADQPGVVAGIKKGMKTSCIVDLAVSLGFGPPVTFLNFHRFQVRQKVNVGIYSGESGAATLQETFRRVCRSKGNRQPRECAIHWCFELPQLSSDADLRRISANIRRHQLRVVIFDPIYLSLLAGNPNASASNLFDVGPLLAKINNVCLDAGATAIFVHHNVKHAAKPYDPPELENVAFAGFQEFARQWILLGRREAYTPGTGNHKLWLNIGSSAGFSGCYAADIDEGVMQSDFSGREWKVTVQTQTDAIRQSAEQRGSAVAARQQDEQQRVREALGHFGRQGETLSMISARSGLTKDKARSCLEQNDKGPAARRAVQGSEGWRTRPAWL